MPNSRRHECPRRLIAPAQDQSCCGSPVSDIRLEKLGPILVLRETSCQISQLFVEPPAMLFKKLILVQQRLLVVPELRQLPF
jgi:hypothetical protein